MEDINKVFEQFLKENECDDIEQKGYWITGLKNGNVFCEMVNEVENKGVAIVRFTPPPKSPFRKPEAEEFLAVEVGEEKHMIKHYDRHDGSRSVKEFNCFMDALYYIYKYTFRNWR